MVSNLTSPDRSGRRPIYSAPPRNPQENFEQVRRYTLAQEKWLAKQGQTEEFNKEFYKTVERGVFKEIGPEEMAA
jgi:hypothetical protein